MDGDRTQHVLWRLQHGNIEGIKPKLAIVMVGQNNGEDNTAREIVRGVVEVVTYLRVKLFNIKILLLAIFPRHKHPTPEREKIFEVNKELSRRYVNNNYVTFMDVNPYFMDHNGTMSEMLFPDFEHPSEAGYVVWADAMESNVAKLFGDSPRPPITD